MIGREDGCDLVVPDPKVSRRHAEIDRNGGGYVLRDLGSANGTYVNGRQVTSVELRGAEQIQLGDTVIASAAADPAAVREHTVIGSVVARSASALHRLALERSLRRVATLAVAAAAIATVATIVLVAMLVGRDGNAIERVVRTAAPSTLPVVALRDGARVGSGTGWVLDGSDGLVVTNAHVLNGAVEVRAAVAGKWRSATVRAAAPCEDLAVLHVPAAAGLRALRLGSQASLHQGATVVAVGYPTNASQEAALTSTTGVVSVVRSSFRERVLDVPRYPNVVQTDAAINAGNSGGPLLDLDGRVVGITAAVLTLGRDGRLVQGQAYAIGADRARVVLAELRRGRSRAWTGAWFEYRTAEQLAREGLPNGLVLASSAPGTPAHEAELGTGEQVLVAVNGMPVGNSLAGYCDAVAGLASGQRLTLTVYDRAHARTRDIVVRLE